MADSWDEMKKAKEDLYFTKQNEEALKKLHAQRGDQRRKSPITGEPMEEIAYKGVVIDRCKTSGGIWLDPGELEKIVDAILKEKEGEGQKFLSSLFSFVGKR